jgi:hypothetical protein
MNDKNKLNHIHVSFWDLVLWHTNKEEFFEMSRSRMKLKFYPHEKATYNQSSVSNIVDEYRNMKTLGNCYNRPSFEIKIKSL